MNFTLLNTFFLKYIIPEIFFVFFVFFLIIFLLYLGVTKLFKFPLISKISVYLAVYSFIFLTLLYVNNFNSCEFIFNDTFAISYGISYLKIIVLFFTIFSILISIEFLRFERINDFEYTILILFVTLGVLMLISSNDFLITYLSIELQSLALYVLVTFKKNTIFSTEAGIKYFIIGSLASIFLLFGFSLSYSIFGSINFNELFLLTLCGNLEVFHFYYYLSIFFILAGLFIKLSIAPFHMWSPDVYEGSPSSITVFMSLVPKISFLIILFRLLFFTFNFLFNEIFLVIIFSAVFSIFIGSFLSLKQKTFKRLLAYSSITHVGFLLMSLSTGTLQGFQSFFVYLLVYLVMTLNVWTVFLSLRVKKVNLLNAFLVNLNSLFYTNSFLASILVLTLLSMAGIPPLAGFWTKYLVFLSLIDSNYFYIAVITVFLSTVSVFYYLKIVKNIFFNKTKVQVNLIAYNQISKLNSIVILLSFLFIIFFFVIFPDTLLVLSNFIVYSFFF